MPVAGQADYTYLLLGFHSSKSQCRGSCASSSSYWLYLYVFAFSLIKIVIREQLCQQLVSLVVQTYFRFFAYKNCNAKAAILAAEHASCTY